MCLLGASVVENLLRSIYSGFKKKKKSLVATLSRHLSVRVSFEQQKELLLLKFEQEKLCRNTEREEKLDIERLRQAERFEFERMRQNEKRKLEMEHLQVQLIREGKVSIGSAAEIGGSLGVAPGNFDVAANLRLVTKFYERDPDAFFNFV